MGDLEETKMNKTEWIKPPIGIMPKWVHDAFRLQAVRDCIERYLEAGLMVRVEWIEEYNQLVMQGVKEDKQHGKV